MFVILGMYKYIKIITTLFCLIILIDGRRPALHRDVAENIPVPWPRGVVYFHFKGKRFTTDERINVMTQMAKISMETCVAFVSISDARFTIMNKRWRRRILSVEHSDNPNSAPCSATFGLKKYPRLLINPKLCPEPSIIHELLHVLGLLHEHARSDRNNYVTVNESNIERGRLHEFNVQPDGLELRRAQLPYDYTSIMHPNAYYFSKDGRSMTIIPLQQDMISVIGQRTKMSKTDWQKVNRMYNCTKYDMGL